MVKTLSKNKIKDNLLGMLINVWLVFFIQKYAQTKKVALDLRLFTGERLDRTTNEEEWNKKLDEHDLLTDAHLYQTQCELF